MTDLEVAFPDPCGEKWEAMAPHGCNRHCAACNTVIHELEALTPEEVDALSASNQKICVRARIAPDGTVATRPSISGKRVVAALGASLSLGLAACQTTPEAAVTPLYTISGKIAPAFGERTVTLTRWDGRVEQKIIATGHTFTFANLYEGTYNIRITSGCDEPIEHQVEVGPAHVNLGTIWMNGDQCIIIGVMMRADRWGRG